jgi:uncharacterized delta-60 repeat protein
MKKIVLTLTLLLLLLNSISAQIDKNDIQDHPFKHPNLSSQYVNPYSDFVLPEKLLNNGISKITTDSVAEAWIKRYSSGLAPLGCNGNDIAIDNDGNIYVTGSIDHPEQNSNCNTLKYNSAGELLWAVQYNGPENENDFASRIYIDQSEYIYVTGSSSGKYATIKYNSSGTEIWVSRYDGPGDYEDYATAIIVDELGNVYITGRSDGYGTDADFATIKYNQNGVEQWFARYNGPGNSWDISQDITIDAQGNVFVTGFSLGDGTSADFATIKYNPSGNEEWVRRYHRVGTDIAYAIAVDESGYIYVTGFSSSSNSMELPYCTTIKYSSSGNQEWVSIYGAYYGIAREITLDASGNIYIAGGQYPRIITAKYNSAGTQQWAAVYPSTESHGEAVDITLDENGNVYVCGTIVSEETYYDYITIKYTSSGTRQWLSRYNGEANNADGASALVIDNSGNIYVTGSSSNEYPIAGNCVTIKYNPLGTEDWIANYNLPGRSLDEAAAMIKDEMDNIYITGKSAGFDSFNDYCTIKYDPNGNLLWTVRYNGPANYHDEPSAIAIDFEGNIYVTGRSFGTGTNFDYTTIKYSPSGVEHWVMRYNGSDNDIDEATDLVIDNFGNIYVTGKSKGSSTDFDYTTIKYDPSGSEQWIAQYNGPGNEYDEAKYIVLDNSGNIYITGNSKGLGTEIDIATIKYHPEGNEIWTAIYAGPEGAWDDSRDIKVDIYGNVYLAGESGGSFTTIKYNSSGILEWMVQYSDTSLENPYGFANALSVDESGNVFVTGGSYDANEYTTIKYNSSGIEQWISRYSEPEYNYHRAKAITMDPEGNIFITGECGVQALHYLRTDYSTIKCSPSGSQLWTARYSGPGSSSPTAISLDRSGNVIVIGSSDDSTGGSNFLTIKYIQDPSSNYDQFEITATYFVLEQNYPNPYNSGTKISWQSPVASHQTIKIFDILGNEIATLVDEYRPAGVYDVQFTMSNLKLSSGVYFYQLKADSYTATKKMILLR